MNESITPQVRSLLVFAFLGAIGWVGGSALARTADGAQTSDISLAGVPALTEGAIVAANATLKAKRRSQESEYIQVEVRGQLNAQVFAIGGETTGVVISARGVTWELDFGDNQAMRDRAGELHDQQVIVQGELNIRKGVEIRQRWIVSVESLVAAEGEQPKDHEQASGYIDPEGSLLKRLILQDSQSGFAGESGSVWTINRDGSWKYQTFLNANLRPAERSGHLTPKQLKELAQVLAQAKFADLPSRLGEEQPANPHVITLRYGEQESSMVLAGGQEPPVGNGDSEKSAEQCFGQVVDTIRKMLSE